MNAARASFADLTADEEAHYFAAPGQKPEDTYRQLAEESGGVMALCALVGAADEDLELVDIELIHEAIFAPAFGEMTLGLRRRFDARDDKVQYPIVVGTREVPEITVQTGSGGRQIKANLAGALAQFLRSVDGIQHTDEPTVHDAALPAVRLYAKIIRIHPFIDGNGRTAMAVLSWAYQRIGLPHASPRVSHETRWALGRALRNDGKQSYDDLTAIVVDAIKGSNPA